MFVSRTTYKSLIHKLGYVKPCTTHDLVDVAMNHTSGEEAVEAVSTEAKTRARPSARIKMRAPPHRGAKRTRRIGTD